MAVSEFSLIKQFFTRPAKNKHTRLSVGDDCALLSVPMGYELAITTDTMVENVHFFPDVSPEDLGHKLLAVNLSDLASMGATPTTVTLALTLPSINEQWLKAFSTGLFALADQHNIDLIGGDTTAGPLTLTIQAMGLVKSGQALQRSNAKVGDLIYVTGTLGDAGLGLKVKQGFQIEKPESILNKFNKPLPKVKEGQQLQNIANACVDISDGLAADLGHILDMSAVGAVLNYEQLPLSEEVEQYVQSTEDWKLPLVAGEDYELCFTVSPEKANELDIGCTCIGVIEEELGLRLNKYGKTSHFKKQGFDHFKEV
ncbi:MAG: thiamine-phosphate kinase [Methyloprofundus sp.]|nr:thiamine-phosphate kinase [Methyloprofundus sp.]